MNDAVTDEVTGSSDMSAVVADPELQAFTVQHVEAAVGLAAAAASTFAATDRPKFATTIATPYPTLLGPAEDAMLEALVSSVDHLVMFSGHPDRNRHVAAMARRSDPARRITMMVTKMRAGEQNRPPGLDDGAAPPRDGFWEAAEVGVDELGLYNYGLLTDDAIRDFMVKAKAVADPV